MCVLVLYDNTNYSKRVNFLSCTTFLGPSYPLAIILNYSTVVNACFVSLTIILGIIYVKI